MLLIIIVSCKNTINVSETKKHNLPQKTEEKKEPIKVKPKPRLEVSPMKTSMSEAEIANSYFVSDTLTKDFTNLIGITDEWTDVYPVMSPATYEGKLSVVFELDDSLRLIPFFIDGEMEEQIFTKWKITTDSTLSYVGRLKPILPSKYSFAHILEKIDIKGEEHFIGMTGSGEGGEYGENIWTAKYNGSDDFDKIDHYETSYNDGENSKRLTYKLDGNSLSIILNTDSMIFKSDTVMEIPIRSELVKTIELK